MKNIFMVVTALSLLASCSSYIEEDIDSSADAMFVSSSGDHPTYDGGGIKSPAFTPNCRSKMEDPTISNHLLSYSSWVLWDKLSNCVCSHSGCEDFCFNQEAPDQECRDTAQYFCLDQWVYCFNDPN